MQLEASILGRARDFEALSQWERRELGRDLRRLGLSYGEIMDLIPVKKSTLATWCREIRLSEGQIEAIKDRRAQEPGIPRDTQRKRRREVELIRAQAQLEAEHLVLDPFWVAGVVLYWGEGGKTRNDLKLANADPRAHRLFIRWVSRYLEESAGFSLQLHLHEGNDEEAAQAFWRSATGLFSANYFKTFIKPAGTGHRKTTSNMGSAQSR